MALALRLPALLTSLTGRLLYTRVDIDNLLTVPIAVSKSAICISCDMFQGIVLHALGNSRLAEKVLRDAVNYEPTFSQAW